jgi:HSP20 family protein
MSNRFKLVTHENPFAYFDRMMNAMNNMFSDEFGHGLVKTVTEKSQFPRNNIWTDKEKCYIEIEAPGLTKEDLSISAKGQYLSVKATKKDQKEEIEYNIRELKYESWKKTWEIPERLDLKKLEARVENGLLTIEIPIIPELKELDEKGVNFEIQ